MRAGAWIALVVLAGAGCGGDSSGGMVRDPGTVTLQDVQSAVLSPRCAVSGCHIGAGAPFQLDLSQGAALHTLLRTPADAPVAAACRDNLALVHAGRRTGATGERYTDVVNIGIGGSDLGPAMACEALARYRTGHVRCHFVSNVDGSQLAVPAGDRDISWAGHLFYLPGVCRLYQRAASYTGR